MTNDEIASMLIRMDEKLNTLLITHNDHELRIRDLEKPHVDHEARLRELEKNDLGRIIPFIVGLLTVAALCVALFK